MADEASDRDTLNDADTSATKRQSGLEEVVRAARELAAQLQKSAAAAGGLAEREIKMLVDVAEDVRDRSVKEAVLKEAREIKFLAGLRGSTHRVVDMGFDALGVSLVVAADVVGRFAGADRKEQAA
jgi:hypothetical protein